MVWGLVRTCSTWRMLCAMARGLSWGWKRGACDYVPKAKTSVQCAHASVSGPGQGWGVWCPCVMSHILRMGCKGEVGKSSGGAGRAVSSDSAASARGGALRRLVTPTMGGGGSGDGAPGRVSPLPLPLVLAGYIVNV